MLQALLAERFHLAFHRETKEVTVDALVLAAPVQRLTPAANPDSPSPIAIRSKDPHGVTLVAQSVTMPFLARYLSGRLHRLVSDATEVAGSFDFAVEVPLDPADVNDPGTPEKDVISHLFTDFVQKIGLKIQPKKMPAEVLAVQSAEKPTEDANLR